MEPHVIARRDLLATAAQSVGLLGLATTLGNEATASGGGGGGGRRPAGGGPAGGPPGHRTLPHGHGGSSICG
jgi:hypothetical protein